MIQLIRVVVSDTDTVGIHRRCCQGELRSTDQPDARQPVHYQGLTSRCWGHHTASIVGRPKMPVGMVRGDSCVGDELKNKRGVLTLRYPVEQKEKEASNGVPPKTAQKNVYFFGQTRWVDGKTTTTAYVREQTLAQPRKPRTQEMPLWYLHHPAWMEVPHGWVPVNTHSAPVRTSVRRLWVALSTSTARAQTSNPTGW